MLDDFPNQVAEVPSPDFRCVGGCPDPVDRVVCLWIDSSVGVVDQLLRVFIEPPPWRFVGDDVEHDVAFLGHHDGAFQEIIDRREVD